MSESRDLDRALDALVRHAATSGARPGAAAAVRTARARRRRSTAGVAVVAAMTVGAVSAPQLLADHLPGTVATAPDPARFDAAALEEATAGWITGWDLEASPSGSFTKPRCDVSVADTASVHGGTTAAAGPSTAKVVIKTFDDVEERDRYWTAKSERLTQCPDYRTAEAAHRAPEEATVRHWAVSAGTEADGESRLSDVWVATSGTTVAELQVTTPQGQAPAEVAQAVGDALLAGAASGWAEEVSWPGADTPTARPELPAYDERELAAALSGWRSRERVPNARLLHPCLSWPDPPLGGASSEGTDPSGTSIGIVGYRSAGSLARERLARTAAALASCPDVAADRRTLGDDVTLFTYDVGSSGHGAIWLAANDDRAMYVSQENAAGPMPADVGPRVAAWMSEVLSTPWPPAS